MNIELDSVIFDADSSRESFEKWLLSGVVEPDLERAGATRYANKAVQQRWLGWQAAYTHISSLARRV